MSVEKITRYKFRAVGTVLPNIRDRVPTARKKKSQLNFLPTFCTYGAFLNP